MRISMVWDVPEASIDALVADFEDVAKKHAASMPDLWQEVRDIQLWAAELERRDDGQ